ncbi:MAG: LytR/AlgR family response regulator transcription factor [Janthinobacterium lividum]
MTEQPLRTLIVDDEELAVRRLAVLCAEIPGVDIVGTESDGARAIEAIKRHRPALVLLDISMPQLDGLAVARSAEMLSVRPAVVFCTASEQHALAAFELAAVDYLLKPVSAERLSRAVDRARLLGPHGKAHTISASSPVDSIWVPHRGAMLRIPTADIDRIEAERDYMRIHVGGASYLLLETITRLEVLLDPERFIRLRRSVIVRRDRVAGLRHAGAGIREVVLRDGTAIRIGATFLRGVKAMLER